AGAFAAALVIFLGYRMSLRRVVLHEKGLDAFGRKFLWDDIKIVNEVRFRTILGRPTLVSGSINIHLNDGSRVYVKRTLEGFETLVAIIDKQVRARCRA